MRWDRSLILAAASFSLFLGQTGFAAEWLQYGRDGRNTRNQSEEFEIHSGNVSQLELKWAYQANSGIHKTPAVEGGEGFIYFVDDAFMATHPEPLDNSSFVYKLDKHGQEIWKRNISTVLGECLGNASQPVLHIATAPAVHGNKVLVGTYPDLENAQGIGGYFIAMNKNTGACESATAVTDPAHPYEGILGSITVHGNVAFMGISSYEEDKASSPGYVCCNTQGKVAAVNIGTGNILWIANMIDPKGDPRTAADDKSPEELAGYSGVTVWSSAPAVYPPAQVVIVTTGNAYSRGANIAPEQLNEFHMSINAYVALDMKTGEKRWVRRMIPDDFWNTSCVPFFGENLENCPEDSGPDWDFGAGCTIVKVDGKHDACAAVNKEGSVHAVDARTGQLLWQTKIGPSSLVGLAGTCYDGETLFATQVNFFDETGTRAWTLLGGPNSGQTIYGGSVSALDPQNGEILWQNADPLSFQPAVFGLFAGAPYLAPPSCIGSGGVVLASSAVPNDFLTFFGFPPELIPTGPNMFAFDAATGELITSLQADAAVISGPAVVDGRVYWGDGFFFSSGTLHSFGLPEN